MTAEKTYKKPQGSRWDFSPAEFVQPDEFCRLLLSSRKMMRFDQPAHQLKGLVDLETGTRFMIEQEKLLDR